MPNHYKERRSREKLQTLLSSQVMKPAFEFDDDHAKLLMFSSNEWRANNDRSTRGNRRGEAANICDRSGSSVDERFAGWKASPSCWKDAGEAEWWRHGRCGQVARKDAAGRSPVHPFAPSRPLANGRPPRHTYMLVFTYTRIHTHCMWTHRGSLFLSSELSSFAHSLLLLYISVFPSPLPSAESSPL